MLYVDSGRPDLTRPCAVTANNGDGTVNLLVDGFPVDRVPVVAVGGIAPTDGSFYAQAEKTAAEIQAELDAAANEHTIGDSLDQALATNAAIITVNGNAATSNDAWLVANPGTSLSLAILTAQVKALTRQNSALANQGVAAARQRNGLIRLVRRKLDSAADTLKVGQTA